MTIATTLVALIIFSGLHSLSHAGVAQTPEIVVSPDTTGVPEETVFQLEIVVSVETTSLMGYNISVVFDGAIIHLQSVDEGSLPSGSGFSTGFYWLNPGDADSVHVNGAILGNTVDGPGTLFTLTFKSAGNLVMDLETDVRIVYSDIRNGVNAKIIHTTRDGYVKVLKTVAVESATWGHMKSKYR